MVSNPFMRLRKTAPPSLYDLKASSRFNWWIWFGEVFSNWQQIMIVFSFANTVVSPSPDITGKIDFQSQCKLWMSSAIDSASDADAIHGLVSRMLQQISPTLTFQLEWLIFLINEDGFECSPSKWNAFKSHTW